MIPEPLEIYQARARWGHSTDPRPCIVLDPPVGDTVTVALISSEMDLYSPSMHFRMDKEHPDFAASGLNKTCYVAGDMIREIKIANLLRRRGRLEGELAAAFRRWI